MPSYPQRPAVMAAIAAHLQEIGPHAWERIMSRFPEVPPRTMWRWISEVKKRRVSGAAEAVGQVECMKENTVSSVMILTQSRFHPLAASIESLCIDADLLRASSLDANGSIKNVRLFERSVRLRLEIHFKLLRMKEVLECCDEFADMVEGVIMEVFAEDVEASHKLIAQLKAWHARHIANAA